MNAFTFGRTESEPAPAERSVGSGGAPCSDLDTPPSTPAEMLARPGLYICGDKNHPKALVPMWVTAGFAYSMKPDEPLSRHGFLPTWVCYSGPHVAPAYRVAADEYATPAPNRAERATAARVERRNSATGTPWQIHSDHLPFTIIGECDVDNHYVPVASTDSDDANPEGVDGANARRIVQCVNGFEPLRKALEQIATADHPDSPLSIRATEHEFAERLMLVARAALAKVRP